VLEHRQEGRLRHDLKATWQDVPLLGEDIADARQEGELCGLAGPAGQGEAASDLNPQLEASRREEPSGPLRRLGEPSLRPGTGRKDPGQDPERDPDHPEGSQEPALPTPLLVASRTPSRLSRLPPRGRPAHSA
jgi:hypothetical protein